MSITTPTWYGPRNPDIPAILQRIQELENEYLRMEEATRLAELKMSTNNQQIMERDEQIEHLKRCLDDKESELTTQIEVNNGQSQEVKSLKEKVTRLKEQRKLDKTRIQELESQVVNLKFELLIAQQDKERAETRAEQLRQQITELEARIKEHDEEFRNLRLNHRAQILEQLETLVNPKLYKSLVEFLTCPSTKNSKIRIEFDAIVATVAQTPTRAAQKFLSSHPELEMISKPLQTMADSVLEVLKFKAGIGKFATISSQLTSIGIPEDVQIQKDFLECLARSSNGMVTASTIAGDFLEKNPIFYFPLPSAQKLALDTIRDKVSSIDSDVVKGQVMSSMKDANNKFRRLFHDKVYDFRGNSYRAAKRFIYAAGIPFRNWWDYIIPFNFFN